MTNRSIHSIDYFPADIEAVRGWASYDREISGANTPYALRKLGLYNENGYRGETKLEFNPVIEVEWIVWGQSQWKKSAIWSNGLKPVPENALIQPSVMELLPKLATKWKESEFNVGVFAAEGKDALKMMANRLKGLYNGSKALRSGNLGGALREFTGQVPKSSRSRMQQRLDTGDVSGAFLEGHLGWSPMFNDLYNLADLLDLRDYTNIVRASMTKKTGIKAAGQPPGSYASSGHYKRTVALKVIVTREANMLERLGLTDPAGIAWEATPLSFIIDYVSPIGNHLAAVHAVGALPVKRVVLTTHDELEGRIKVGPVVSGRRVRNAPLPGVIRHYVTKRDIHGSIHDIISGWAFMPTNITPKWDKGLKQIGILSSLVHQGFLDMVKGGRLDVSLNDLPLPGRKK